MTFKIPASIRDEHEMLRERLSQAVNELGPVGEHAREVARLFEARVQREMELLRPLGLLEGAAARGITADMAEALPTTRRLKAELPALLSEHRALIAALRRMVEAAREADMPRHERFAAALILHMRIEEQVLFPAVIVLGDAIERLLAPAAVLDREFGEEYVP